MDIVVAIVVGIGSGLAASLIFWYLQFRIFRAKVKISPRLARYRVSDEGTIRHQLKIQNVGRREVIDVEIAARIALTGLARKGFTDTLTLESWRRPQLKPGKSAFFLIAPTRLSETTRRWYSQYFSSEIRHALDDGRDFELEELLAHGEKAEIRVYVFATDALSGARALESCVYKESDFRTGRFSKGSFEHTGVFLDEPEGLPAHAAAAESRSS